jgi:hypothetical protein
MKILIDKCLPDELKEMNGGAVLLSFFLISIF